jgi:hypothetical protein
VGRLACVLFQVGAHNADASPVRQFQPTVDVDGDVVLADLVVLGHVGIEVVLAVEYGRLHPGVQRRPDPHGQFDRSPVQHGE